MANSFYGEPRTTLYIDLIIHPTEEQIHHFIELIGDSAYISEEAAISALQRKSMFNIIDYQTGWKADLIIRKDRDFSITEFERRRKANVFDIEMFIVSPEDSILSKLEWAKKSLSDKQYLDLFSVASIKKDKLDFEYINKWAIELEVSDLLQNSCLI
ncbi:hypothetical protein [Candidatus Uabimicrobium amorphum]|uniref:Uncharacterized protein n=1 Tax=Uabimicrobium amorphum TaxID=2596890 RepID=A0A5S9IKQ1_UABAM|nr:hypothetical protein [Candidatus Uabimicrobium amorphum]BBM83331.1 hypothetical protein UABAM_01683 [Candidatus Uabimicrobium amorphum]